VLKRWAQQSKFGGFLRQRIFLKGENFLKFLKFGDPSENIWLNKSEKVTFQRRWKEHSVPSENWTKKFLNTFAEKIINFT